MYLRDYLHDIPLKALKAIASSLKVSVEYKARIKLINAIDRAFWDGYLTEKLIKGLPKEELRVLSLLAFSYDAAVEEKELARKIDELLGMNSDSARTIVNNLVPIALAGGVKREENQFFCPRGIAEQVRKSLISEVIELSGTEGKILSSTPPNLMEDIFSFLAEAYKDRIPLTLMGNLKKTFIDRVFKGSMTCNNPDLKIATGDRNSFVVEYLKTRLLIKFDRRKAQTQHKLGGWLKLSATERFNDIVSYALKHIFHDSQAIIAFTGILAEIPTGTTFIPTKLAYFMHTRTMANGDLSKLETPVHEMLTILCQLGMASYSDRRFALTVAGELLFKGKSLPIDDTTSDSFTIQPNFELIVGPEFNPLTRFTLELLTKRKKRDMVLTYEVTQKGITRARERGMDTEEILDFFELHSRTAIPQNVRFSIENWARSYGSIYFEQTTIMRFKDQSTCSSVMHFQEISPYIKERLTDTILVISYKQIKKITVILKKNGYQPEVFGEAPLETVNEEEPFIPVSIDDILKDKSLPATNSEFIFPDNLISDEDSS